MLIIYGHCSASNLIIAYPFHDYFSWKELWGRCFGGVVGRGQFFRWKKLVGARRASRDNKDIMSTIGERVTRCSKRLRTAYFINVPRFDRLVFDFLVSLLPSESRFSILASIELTRASLFPGREREKERDCKLIGVSFSNSEFLSTARSDQKFKSKPSVDSDFLS